MYTKIWVVSLAAPKQVKLLIPANSIKEIIFPECLNEKSQWPSLNFPTEMERKWNQPFNLNKCKIDTTKPFLWQCDL